MGTRHGNRLWLLGGVVAIIVVVAATYLLAIKPIYTEKADLQGQAADQDVQLVELRHQLSDLEAKAKDTATYTAQRDVLKAALPKSYDLTAYLRALQISEKSVTVQVGSVGINIPQAIKGTDGVYAVPFTLEIQGAPANIARVIKRLQITQSRAVLITSVSLTVTSDTDAKASIMLNAFCRKSDGCVATAS